MIFIVTIQDKTLYGEPDIALAVVDAADETEALRAAWSTIEQLAERGGGRCVPHAKQVEPGKFYRLGEVARLPRDPNAVEERGRVDERAAPRGRTPGRQARRDQLAIFSEGAVTGAGREICP